MPDLILNRERLTTQTVGDGATASESIPLVDESVYMFEVRALGQKQGSADTYAYWRRAHVERASGTSALVNLMDTSDSEDQAGANCVLSVDDGADTFIVTVTGDTGTVDWTIWIDTYRYTP